MIVGIKNKLQLIFICIFGFMLPSIVVVRLNTLESYVFD